MILTETWDFGDGSPLTSAHNPTHTFPLNNHGYLVTHTITTQSGTYTYSQTVIQSGGPTANIVGDAVNSCGAGTLPYSANPCQSGIIYTWIAIGGSPTSTTGCNANINWTSLSGGSLILTAFDPVNDCYGYDTIVIPPCCDTTTHGQVVFNNRTASSILSDPYYIAQGYVSGSNFTYASHIVVNTHFVVDVPFTFLNCDLIDMGPNAKIDILPGQTLTFDNSETSTKCNYMWDGIYINGVSATLKVINNSVLRQAKNAVVSLNGGRYVIENSRLEDDLKGIVVKPYQGQHPGVIRGSQISMPGTFLQAVPALLWWQTKTLVGIEIENNADITIGDASQITYKNTFRNMFNAIWSKQSNANVVNARIANLSSHLNATNNCEGIVSEGGKQVLNPPYFYQIKVGGTAVNEPVTFDSTRIAIETKFPQRVFVRNNTIKNTRFYGIFIQRNNSGIVQISSNGIMNLANYGFSINTGIYIRDSYFATVQITGNNLNQQNATTASQSGTGIYVANVQPGPINLTISSNAQIRRFRTGIWLQNLDGKNTVFVNNNTIGLFKSNTDYTSMHYGIRLENCVTVRVDHNWIQRYAGGNWTLGQAAFAANLRGISFENSPGSVVYQNDIRRMGDGIFGFGVSSSSTLACNDLWRCYNGFKFSGAGGGGADIGDQIIDPNTTQPAPTGNVWTASVNADLTGTIFPTIHWYENAPINEQMAPGSLSDASNQNNPYIISSANLCGTIFQLAPPQVAQRSTEAGVVIQQLQTNSNTLSPEQVYLTRKYVHRKLRQNPQWLVLGTPQDSLYQNFYQQTDTANFGRFRTIEENAAVDNQPLVEADNSVIACTGMMDHNLKVVTEIYSRTWMMDVFEFSPADSATLYSIATLNPCIDGAGVYSARALLGLSVDDVTGNVSYRTSGENETSVNTSSLYPNPAKGSVTVEINLLPEETGVLEIFDINGRLIQKQTVSGETQLATLDVSAVEAGIYMVRLNVNGETRMNERLVILK
ncbi:MAG: hypothetical protein Fur0041_17450 [Bacteroidia bacterium]